MTRYHSAFFYLGKFKLEKVGITIHFPYPHVVCESPVQPVFCLASSFFRSVALKAWSGLILSPACQVSRRSVNAARLAPHKHA